MTALSTNLLADPTVTYTVTGGGPGDYTVDLTVNNTAGFGDIWGIGLYNGYVDPILSDPTGSPPGFSVNGVNWLDLTFPNPSALPAGATLSGFIVPFSTPALPTPSDVGYTIYEGGNVYFGPGAIYTGFASAAATPDSGTTLALLGLALGAVGCVSRGIRKN